MSKAVLVIDMPEDCMSCKLKSRVHGISNVTHCCNLAEGMITLESGFDKRLDNCPLVLMPKKDNPSDYHDDYSDGCRDGWNAAIDAITGDVN